MKDAGPAPSDATTATVGADAQAIADATPGDVSIADAAPIADASGSSSRHGNARRERGEEERMWLFSERAILERVARRWIDRALRDLPLRDPPSSARACFGMNIDLDIVDSI